MSKPSRAETITRPIEFLSRSISIGLRAHVNETDFGIGKPRIVLMVGARSICWTTSCKWYCFEPAGLLGLLKGFEGDAKSKAADVSASVDPP